TSHFAIPFKEETVIVLIFQEFCCDSFVSTTSSRTTFVVTTAVVSPNLQTKLMTVVRNIVIYCDKFISKIGKSAVSLSKETSWVCFIEKFPEAVVKLNDFSASFFVFFQEFFIGICKTSF